MSNEQPAYDELKERGVHNPRVIDLISTEKLPFEDGAAGSADEVVLSMFEYRPWNSDPDQLDQLQEKFNNYLDYALEGYLMNQFPQYVGKKIAVQVICASEPGEREQMLLEAMSRYLLSGDMRLVVTINENLVSTAVS